MSASILRDALVQSAISVDHARRTALVDVWIGSRVRIKRSSRGMSQQEFSELLGIHQNDLAAFEAGVERIKANLLFRIAEALDVRPDYFFRGYAEENAKAL